MVAEKKERLSGDRRISPVGQFLTWRGTKPWAAYRKASGREAERTATRTAEPGVAEPRVAEPRTAPGGADLRIASRLARGAAAWVTDWPAVWIARRGTDRIAIRLTVRETRRGGRHAANTVRPFGVFDVFDVIPRIFPFSHFRGFPFWALEVALIRHFYLPPIFRCRGCIGNRPSRRATVSGSRTLEPVAGSRYRHNDIHSPCISRRNL